MTFFGHAKKSSKKSKNPHGFEVVATGCFVQVIHTKGVTDRPATGGGVKRWNTWRLGGKIGSLSWGSFLETTWTHSSNSPEVHFVHLPKVWIYQKVVEQTSRVPCYIVKTKILQKGSQSLRHPIIGPYSLNMLNNYTTANAKKVLSTRNKLSAFISIHAITRFLPREISSPSGLCMSRWPVEIYQWKIVRCLYTYCSQLSLSQYI